MSLHSPPGWQNLTTPVSTQFGSFGAQSVHCCPHVFPAQGLYGPASIASPPSFLSPPPASGVLLPELPLLPLLLPRFGAGLVPSFVASGPPDGSSPMETRELQPTAMAAAR